MLLDIACNYARMDVISILHIYTTHIAIYESIDYMQGVPIYIYISAKVTNSNKPKYC